MKHMFVKPFLALAVISLLPLSLYAAPRREVPSSQAAIKQSFAPLVKKTAPAVVNVYSQRVVRSRVAHPFFSDPFFQEFFGGGLSRERVEQSLGSGVIVRSNGLVITNSHVVENAQELIIVLADGREFKAQLLLADKKTDLAILKIDTNGESLPVMPLDRDGDAEVGDLVLAIGNPFGVGQTVTQGIISALGRSAKGVSDFSLFIQTDAAINPGNSGGALVDLDGELIGVNTIIFSRSGGSNGIGFAVPVNLVRQVLHAALNKNTLIRPWLGAKSQRLTRDILQSLSLEEVKGVLINEVYPESSAGKGGLKPGDVILKIGDKDIRDTKALDFYFSTHTPGDKVAFTILRQGQEKTFSVLALKPPSTLKANKRLLKGRHPFAGLTVVNLSPAYAERLGRNPFDKGVIVEGLARQSVAARLGFQPGDRLVSVNRTPVNTVADLEDLLRQKAGETYLAS